MFELMKNRAEGRAKLKHSLAQTSAAPYASASSTVWSEPRFDGRAFTQDQFIAYCRELRSKGALQSVRSVVVHHSATPESAYDKQTLPQVLRNWWHYYRITKGWSGAPHGVIMSRDPGIGILNVMTQDGIHCSNNNINSRGGEIVGDFTSVLPSGRLLDNAVVFFAGTLYAAKLTIHALTYHRIYLATACPGEKLVQNWSWFRGLVDAKLKEIEASEKPKPPLEKVVGIVAELSKTLDTAVGQIEEAKRILADT